jgi:hypothetical protein
MRSVIWKIVPHRPEWEASSEGELRSTLTKGVYGRGKNKRGQMLAFPYNPETQRSRTVNLAPLVCAAFHGLPPKGMMAMKINGDISDVRACNLRWGTQTEINALRMKLGNHTPKKRTRFLSAAQYSQIRELSKKGLSQVQISRLIGCSNATISKIQNGKIKQVDLLSDGVVRAIRRASGTLWGECCLCSTY